MSSTYYQATFRSGAVIHGQGQRLRI